MREKFHQCSIIADAVHSITQKNASASEAAEESSRRPSGDAPSKSVVYDEKCIICEKSSKYMKGQNTREPLIQCSELRAEDWIRKAAVTKLDQRMLAITSRELVAAFRKGKHRCRHGDPVQKHRFWPQYSAVEETSLQRCQQSQSHQVLGGGMEMT